MFDVSYWTTRAALDIIASPASDTISTRSRSTLTPPIVEERPAMYWEMPSRRFSV